MRILVPVKQVAVLDPQSDWDPADAQLDAGSLELELNEWDHSSLEVALQLAEQSEGIEVVVATVGPEEAEEILRTCLAKGADRAIRVWGDGFDELDELGVARVLAAVAAGDPADLILCGVQSSDAATGVALAGLLDVPHVAVAKRVERGGGGLWSIASSRVV